ncbi:MAG: GNAT family N-acetyltransferase [Rhodospirillales bacterium]|nr:GNAT family N-acetyltransferase [Rhodospirillales bacterium]
MSDDQIAIRKATVADTPRLAEIDEQTFYEPGMRLVADQFQAVIEAQNALLWVADQDGLVVGYIFMVLHDRDSLVDHTLQIQNDEKYVGQVASIAVDEEHQGRGIAGVLIDVVEDFWQLAYPEIPLRIVMEAEPGNEASLGLFRSRGYEPAGQIDDYYATGKPAIRLQKKVGNERALTPRTPFPPSLS